MGTESKETNNGRKKRIWPILLIVVLGLSGGAGGYYYNYVRPYVSTDNAFIEASIVRVSPQVNGQVLRVHVEDNQLVQAGELLVEIDPKPYETALEGARAALHVAESRKSGEEVGVELTEATTAAGLEQAEAQLTAAKAAVDQAHAAVAAAQAQGAIYGIVRQQAATLAFVDCFRLMAILAAIIIPLVIFMRKSPPATDSTPMH